MTWGRLARVLPHQQSRTHIAKGRVERPVRSALRPRQCPHPARHTVSELWVPCLDGGTAKFTCERCCVATAMLFAGVPHRDHAVEAGELLARLGIDRPDARVERQSVGQQQRIAIARALAATPALILADEPTAALDPENAKTAVELLQSVCRDRGAALVLTSHDPSLAEAFERRIDFNDLIATERRVSA